jgi:hypothetical protein
MFRLDLAIIRCLNFKKLMSAYWSRVSSGSIVSDYGLDDRAIGV